MPTLVLLVLASLLPYSAGFCPSTCQCTEDPYPTVDCRGADLDYIPYTLNPRIKSLDLRDNRITRVMMEELSTYQDLEVLDLSGNSIFEVQESAFYGLRRLEVLRISSNQIATLHADHFATLKQLRVLDISGNGVSRIPTSAFADLARLELLNVSNNVIMDISPGAFTGLAGLKELAVENNALSRVPAAAFRPMTQLRIVNLSKNVLVSIERNSFKKQSQLVSLDLGRNSLESLNPGDLRGLRSLKHLNLDFNKLTTIPSTSLSSLPTLVSLSLKGNHFATVPTSAFDGLSHLTQLTIANSAALKSVQMNAFSGLFSLETLRLCENPSLATISQFAFEQSTHLRHLYLSSNNISSLAVGTLTLQRLETLDIRHNPWHCDCQVLWLSRFLSSLGNSVEVVATRTSALCYSPEAMLGRSILDTSDLAATCPGSLDDGQIVMTIILVGSILFLLTVLAVACFSIRRRLAAAGRKYGFLPPPASPNPSSTHYTTTTSYAVDPKYYEAAVSAVKSAQPSHKHAGVSNCYYYTDELWLQAEEQRSFLSSSGYYSNISLQRSPKSMDDGGTLYKVVSKYPVPITEL